jgi:hypothetical protein
MQSKDSCAVGNSIMKLKTRSESKYVTALQHNDVLLGRGAFAINYVGNVLFRELCRGRRDEYNAALRRKQKTGIAREILREVRSNNGRFLRQATENEQMEAHLQGIPFDLKVWVFVDEGRILDKVKQSIRERDYHPMAQTIFKREKLPGVSMTSVNSEISKRTSNIPHSDIPFEVEISNDLTLSPDSKTGESHCTLDPSSLTPVTQPRLGFQKIILDPLPKTTSFLQKQLDEIFNGRNTTFQRVTNCESLFGLIPLTSQQLALYQTIQSWNNQNLHYDLNRNVYQNGEYSTSLQNFDCVIPTIADRVVLSTSYSGTQMSAN